MNAVGIKAKMIFMRRPLLFFSSKKKCIATARIAPDWIKILKKEIRFRFSTFRNELRIIRWPVEEIGRNSVKPSTIDARKT